MYVAVRFQGITDYIRMRICMSAVRFQGITDIRMHTYVAVISGDHRHTYAHMYVAVRFQGITDIRMCICM